MNVISCYGVLDPFFFLFQSHADARDKITFYLLVRLANQATLSVVDDMMSNSSSSHRLNDGSLLLKKQVEGLDL